MPALRKPDAKQDKFAALREARAKGGRLQQWKPEEDTDLYDEVTDDQYQTIVGSRQEQDDFIIDDDGSGYVDNGQEDWDDNESEESEDEDDFEGEDEELKKARKLKRAKLRAKLAKVAKPAASKPRVSASDYSRPAVASGSTYRPAQSAVKEEDFMAGLLSGLTAAPAEPVSRKRRSSPQLPSSDSHEPSSDHSYFGVKKRYGQDSDDEDYSRRRSATGKKPRVSEATIVPSHKDEPDYGDFPDDGGMDLDEPMPEVKGEVISDDEEMEIKAKSAPLAASKPNGQAARRKLVNSTSVKHVVPKPEPVVAKVEPDMTPIKPKIAAEKKPALNGAAHWSSVQASLENSIKTNELEAVKAPMGSTKVENVIEKDGTLQMYWLDQMELDGVVHLVGKVLDKQSNRYVSACVSITGIERNVFIKPRAKRFQGGVEVDVEVSPKDFFEEIERYRRDTGISEWKAKFVKRKYAFDDKGVEKGESEWFKVVYGFDEPELPQTASGATFSHVFGSNTSAFELLVLKRKIMGPCWLQIANVSQSAKSTSWCKVEFTVNSPKNVNPFSELANIAAKKERKANAKLAANGKLAKEEDEDMEKGKESVKLDPEEATKADSSQDMGPATAPPLTMMSISMRTIVNHRENKTELLCVTTRTWEGCNIDDPTPPDRLPSSLNTIVRPIEKFPSNLEARAKTEASPFQTVKAERALLNSLLATIQKHDPDVIVSHNFLGGNFEALLYRMKELKADHWSRIGRFRRKAIIISKMGSNARLMAGRLIADLSSDAAKGMISSTTWSMTEMCNTHLKIQREDVDPEDTHTYFDHTLSNPDRLIKYIRLCEVDAYFQMAIASRVQMLPLTKQLTNLAGNSWNLTLNGGRAVRNEFILLHEFHRLKYVCPDKMGFKKENKAKLLPSGDNDDDEEQPSTSTRVRGKAKYAGGLVFEPKRGLWDTYILVMDFNSLYPSIIQEYNIDFTTVERDIDEDAEEEKIPDVPSRDVAQGVLPRIIATLVNRRQAVKALMKREKEAAKLKQYDIRQQALKLTANSMYGCLGFAGSRFSSRPLAALTTFKGREILTHTRELAESLQLDVVYGDTDSVFVNSNVTTYPEALKIANDFKKLVNERYKLLEIDLDAVFERILLLNKKKYAAVKIDEAGTKITEVKGLDMKRREFSKVSKDSSSAVLREILSGEVTENVVGKVHELLTTLGERVRSGEVPLEDFIIFKRLGKNPEDYPDKKSQPHVQVALRMKSKGAAVRAHDVIPYIICLGEDGKSGKTASADKAFHPDDLRRQGSELKIDYDFYLDSQILQPILRLCESIEGTERARLAECLGLDPARYAQTSGQVAEKEFFTFESQISDGERFKDADAFSIRCMACEATFAFEGLMGDSQSHVLQAIGVVCPGCSGVVPTPSVAVQLELAVRSHISKYYLAWTVCDGEGCGARTRMMGVYGRRCLGFVREGCRGTVSLEYTDTKLYNQLLYYHSLFDTEKALASSRGTGRGEEVKALATANIKGFAEILAVVERYLERNGRRYVDMKGLFGFMERLRM